MKTKNILFLYVSILAGFLIKDFFKQNFLITYFFSIVLVWGSLLSIDYIFRKLKMPIIKVEKREERSGRELGADIVRTIAVLFVPTIHFFGLTYYYSTPFSEKMIFPTMIRWLSLCAVPLFLIISGYFKINSRFNKKHFFAIIPLLFTHIFISLIRVYVDYKIWGKSVDLDYILNKVLYFEYGWYIRLYIGMLFLMPFFNIAYKSLNEKWKKEAIILVLVGLNALGPITFDVIPSSWNILYVFGYYLIGAYLSEYKIKINPILNILLIGIILYITSYSTYLHCMGDVFDWSYIGYKLNSGYSSMVAFIVSSLIMILFININFSFRPLNFFFEAISLVSLEMYLFSQMFDEFIYKEIIENNVSFFSSFENIFVLVGASFLLSFMLSWVKKCIFLIGYLFKRKKEL